MRPTTAKNRREIWLMDEANLQEKLNELVKVVGGLGDMRYYKLAMLAWQAHECHK